MCINRKIQSWRKELKPPIPLIFPVDVVEEKGCRDSGRGGMCVQRSRGTWKEPEGEVTEESERREKNKPS